MEEEWTHFVDSKGSDKQKLISIAIPDSTKKSKNFSVNKHYKKWLEGYKKKNPYLTCWHIS